MCQCRFFVYQARENSSIACFAISSAVVERESVTVEVDMRLNVADPCRTPKAGALSWTVKWTGTIPSVENKLLKPL